MQSCQDSVSPSFWRHDPGKGMSSSWENASAQQGQLVTSWYHHVLLSHGLHIPTGLCGARNAATVRPEATPALHIPWGCCHSELAVGCCPPSQARSSLIQWQVAPGEALASARSEMVGEPWIWDSKGNSNLPSSSCHAVRSMLLAAVQDLCAKLNGCCTSFPKWSLFTKEQSQPLPM